MPKPRYAPLRFRERPIDEMLARAEALSLDLRQRRSVRQFSARPVPRTLVEQALLAAVSAPSGANMQPWHFVVVSTPELKRRIRELAEAEEREFYERRAPAEWLEALEPLGTDANKPFLETAPYLIVVFSQAYGVTPGGRKVKNYYVQESVGIAVGLLIATLHVAGLATLTHTPSPMNFLNDILHRPANERPYLVLVTGYPSTDAEVPIIDRKSLDAMVTFT
jgi:iodotyrosine deiodinase